MLSKSYNYEKSHICFYLIFIQTGQFASESLILIVVISGNASKICFSIFYILTYFF